MATEVVGLTGGIGSGKSAAAACFARLGVPVVDADEIAHALTGANGAAMPAILMAFGEAARRDDGSMNRSYMREQVFSDTELRQRLEGILHPLILSESQRQLRAAQGPYALLVVPLLFEQPRYQAEVKRSLLIDCDETVQVARVQSRSGLTEQAVRAIMAAQMTRAQRQALADDVIDNSGTLAQLQLQVEAKHQYYLAHLAHCQ